MAKHPTRLAPPNRNDHGTRANSARGAHRQRPRSAPAPLFSGGPCCGTAARLFRSLATRQRGHLVECSQRHKKSPGGGRDTAAGRGSAGARCRNRHNHRANPMDHACRALAGIDGRQPRRHPTRRRRLAAKTGQQQCGPSWHNYCRRPSRQCTRRPRRNACCCEC